MAQQFGERSGREKESNMKIFCTGWSNSVLPGNTTNSHNFEGRSAISWNKTTSQHPVSELDAVPTFGSAGIANSRLFLRQRISYAGHIVS